MPPKRTLSTRKFNRTAEAKDSIHDKTSALEAKDSIHDKTSALLCLCCSVELSSAQSALWWHVHTSHCHSPRSHEYDWVCWGRSEVGSQKLERGDQLEKSLLSKWVNTLQHI